MYNIFQPVEEARITNSINSYGLRGYTQENCQVTLENGLYRIYRPANLDQNNQQWGGLVICNTEITGNQILMKGHTYIIKFHVKGKSSNECEGLKWVYYPGLRIEASGLIPSPINVTYNRPGVNFNGEMDCFYKFTVSDDVYKVCTYTHGNFVEGETYLSYHSFMYYWGYTATGTEGTDVYLSDFRMYDITDPEKIQFENNSTVKTRLMSGPSITKAQMYKDTEFFCNDIYEC